VASSYDATFTASVIGTAQRLQVATEINRCFRAGDRVLELNCGTGEDALQLGRRGVEVTAYDASPAMIGVANQKLQAEPSVTNVSFGVLRNEDLGLLEGSFDGAFSNFAGMNCCRDWPGIAAELARLIKPGGHVLLCMMGRTCLWEILYFLLRGQADKAFRRRSRNRVARIGAGHVDVHYLSVSETQQAFSSEFSLHGWRGVGVFVPPTYCESLMRGHSKLLRLLAAIDSRFGHMPGARSLGDHILLDFVRHAR